jgi:sporulation protein YlmC with PRC-barrel domain
MKMQKIHVELLVGRRVRARNGHVVGRLEEIRAHQQGRGWYVEEFLIGKYALLERLAGSTMARSLLTLLGRGSKQSSYRIPWDKLDLSDPKRPRLVCEVGELLPVEIEE